MTGFRLGASQAILRTDEGLWRQVESYVHDQSQADFSHSICPACVELLYPGLHDDDPQPSPGGA